MTIKSQKVFKSSNKQLVMYGIADYKLLKSLKRLLWL